LSGTIRAYIIFDEEMDKIDRVDREGQRETSPISRAPSFGSAWNPGDMTNVSKGRSVEEKISSKGHPPQLITIAI
jgi:hypothetical protein